MPGEERSPTTLAAFLEQIRGWYAADHRGFATLYDAAVAHAAPRPEGTAAEAWFDWRGRTIDDLCRFFHDWHEAGWTTGPGDVLRHIARFSWLSYGNEHGRVFVTSGPGLEMTRDFTRLQGLQMDDEGERGQRLVETWKRELGSRMADFEPGPWRSFNAFFTRALADERSRPIDAPEDAGVVVAPTDCVVNMIVGDLTEETPIPVKTVAMNVARLLDGSPHHRRFVPRRDGRGRVVTPGGTAVSCVLMPDTYHWYHAPVGGEVVEARDDIGGVHYGMRDFPALLGRGGAGFDYGTFDDFRRGYLVFRTRFADPRGREHETHVAMVTVGLNSIASVNHLPEFKRPSRPVPVRKGQRIGNFAYGGSLVILLFEYARFPALQLRTGQRIGTLETRERAERYFSAVYRDPA